MIKIIGYVNCTMDMVYFVTKEENIVEEITKKSPFGDFFS